MHNTINPMQEPRGSVRPPMVYVTEPLRWEYKLVVHSLEEGKALNEEELNALGAEGWELAGIIFAPPTAYHYFKRPART